MRTPTIVRAPVVAALGLALVLGAGACGDDGDASTDTTGAGPATEPADPYGAPTDDTGTDTTAAGAPASGDAVVMEETSFAPGSLEVAVGTEVTWTNEDPFAHTTTADDGAWDSGELDEGATFSHTFDEAGTFSYVCEIHGGMSGEIVVE